MNKPRLTERVLKGLTDAICRMEADDIFDLPDDEQKAFDAATKWVQQMYQWRAEKRDPKNR